MTPEIDFRYVGEELDVFSHAANWKSYVRHEIGRFLTGDVLEVGAGIGAATECFYDGTQLRWVCLEPDPRLAERIPREKLPHADRCAVKIGSMQDLDPGDRFDAILYMDVLEHIEDDRRELANASNHLKPGGALVVLSPALPWLYSPFDAAIGHFRRYTKASLRLAAPRELSEERCLYLDSIGLLASAGNRLLLRSGTPTLNQIRFWDRCLIPLSRLADPLCGHAWGRSVLAIWRRRG